MINVDSMFDNVQKRADNGDKPSMAEYGMLAISALLTAPERDENTLFETAITVSIPFMSEVDANGDIGSIFIISLAARFQKTPKEIRAALLKRFMKETGLTEEEIKEQARAT